MVEASLCRQDQFINTYHVVTKSTWRRKRDKQYIAYFFEVEEYLAAVNIPSFQLQSTILLQLERIQESEFDKVPVTVAFSDLVRQH